MACSKNETVAFVTFWALASFSFFIASDNLEVEVEAPVLTPAVAALRIVVHTAALNCLSLSMLEMYLLHGNDAWICKRPHYTEWQSALSGAALLVLNFLVATQSAYERRPVDSLTSYRLVPWLLVSATGVVHSRLIVLRARSQ